MSLFVREGLASLIRFRISLWEKIQGRKFGGEDKARAEVAWNLLEQHQEDEEEDGLVIQLGKDVERGGERNGGDKNSE